MASVSEWETSNGHVQRRPCPSEASGEDAERARLAPVNLRGAPEERQEAGWEAAVQMLLQQFSWEFRDLPHSLVLVTRDGECLLEVRVDPLACGWWGHGPRPSTPRAALLALKTGGATVLIGPAVCCARHEGATLAVLLREAGGKVGAALSLRTTRCDDVAGLLARLSRLGAEVEQQMLLFRLQNENACGA